eukprot:m51a1_g4073 hypothetical protein (392) ;mRNA; r:759639-761081
MSSFSSSVVPEDSDAFPWQYIVVPVLAFFCELMDSSLGMGYGTTLTPVLLTPVFGFERAVIVQSILVSEAATGLLATIFHGIFHNINIGIHMEKYLPQAIRKRLAKTREREGQDVDGAPAKPDNQNEVQVESIVTVIDVELPKRKTTGEQAELMDEDEESDHDNDESVEQLDEKKAESSWWYRTWFAVRSRLTVDMQIILIMSFTGVLGTIVSSWVTIIKTKDQKLAVKLYIGFMVLAMGVIMVVFALFHLRVKYASWKICILGLVTGFNKGISGGGYGPMAVSGQVIVGRPNRNAIAVTSATEFVICISGIVCDFVFAAARHDVKDSKDHYTLVPYLLIGACLSVPFATYCTRVVKSNKLKYIVGALTILLGTYTVITAFLSYKKIWTGA